MSVIAGMAISTAANAKDQVYGTAQRYTEISDEKFSAYHHFDEDDYALSIIARPHASLTRLDDNTVDYVYGQKTSY